MKANSRHGLRVRPEPVIPPGGKCVGVLHHFLGQQCHQQFPIEPGPSALLIVLGQGPQGSNLLEPFEDQFDLPTKPIPLAENSASGNVVNTVTNLAYSRVWGLTVRDSSMAFALILRCACSIAVRVLRIAHTRPATGSLSSCRNTFQLPTWPGLVNRCSLGSNSNRPPLPSCNKTDP